MQRSSPPEDWILDLPATDLVGWTAVTRWYTTLQYKARPGVRVGWTPQVLLCFAIVPLIQRGDQDVEIAFLLWIVMNSYRHSLQMLMLMCRSQIEWLRQDAQVRAFLREG